MQIEGSLPALNDMRPDFVVMCPQLESVANGVAVPEADAAVVMTLTDEDGAVGCFWKGMFRKGRQCRAT